MSTIYLRHIITSCDIKAIRRRLDELLDFDPQIVDTKNNYPLLSDAEDMGYPNNYAYLQDRFVGYYAKRDRELDEHNDQVYGHDNREFESVEFAVESLMEYLMKELDVRIDYSVLFFGSNIVTIAIAAHVYD